MWKLLHCGLIWLHCKGMKCIGYWSRVLDWGLMGSDEAFEIDVRDVFGM